MRQTCMTSDSTLIAAIDTGCCMIADFMDLTLALLNKLPTLDKITEGIKLALTVVENI